MAVIENDVIKVTVSNSSTKNVIKVSPGVAALASVSLSINDLNDVDTSNITNGQTIVYENGNFVAGDAGAVKTVNDTNPDVDGNVNVSLSSLPDTSISNPADNDYLKYLNDRWVNDQIDISDVTGLQSSLDDKAETNTVPSELNDLSDVNIVGTPTGNQALIFDGAAGVFKSLPNFSNRFEDEAENNKQLIVPFAERVYTVKADGDGIFIDAQSDTPTAGKVIKRKIYQKTGFLESGAVIGDFTLIHTFADDTAYSATESTFEGFRDGDTYGTPPFTLIQTWEEVTAAPAFTGLLNETYGSGAEAAYSTRRLNGLYSGDCMTIRRASDGTTQSIGFVGEEIDESAIETFCSGTTCTVATWFDQSGNGNNATQTDSTKQPTIYTGGALVKEGGRLALDFDGSDDVLKQSGGLLNGLSSYSLFSTFNPLTSAVAYESYIHQALVADPFNNTFELRRENTNNRFNPISGQSVPIQYTTSAINNLQLLVSVLRNGATTNKIYQNGAFERNLTANSYTINAGDFAIGGRSNDTFFSSMNAQEFVIYPSDKSTDRTDIEGNISAYFQSAKLLDESFGSGAEAAYSTRQLRRDQTDCMVIRRASDSTTQTIGFDGSGNIDEAAINTFCSGTSCTVQTWKDQSGNGRDVTTTGTEPTIYTGGAIVRNDGFAGVDFSGANSLLQYTTGDINISAITAINVAKITGATNVDSFAITMQSSNNDGFRTHLISPQVRNRTAGVNEDYLIQKASQLTFKHIHDITSSTTIQKTVLTGTGSASQSGLTFSTNSLPLTIGGASWHTGKYYRGIINEAILFGVDKETSGDIGSIRENVGDYFTQNTPLLDTYSGAAAAYSLRLLDSSYVGSAVEVYNGSSYADIGFNVFGELDTVALAAHCGSNNGFVSKWYDQAGSNDATQTTTASMPKIYDGVTGVVTENGKPAVEFDGSNDFFTYGIDLEPTTYPNNSNYLVCTPSAQYRVALNITDTTELISIAYGRTTGEMHATTYNGSSAVSKSGAHTLDTQAFVESYHDLNSLSVDLYVNNTELTGTNVGEGGTSDSYIGQQSENNRFWSGKIQEVITYKSDQSANRTGIEDNINTFYSIY